MSDQMLTRELPFEAAGVSAEGGGDGNTLEGYGAVFNSPTRINSWEGVFDEQIAPGAFKRTLKERQPVLQFDHGHHPLVGSIPIGSFEELKEDDHGLYVRAGLHDNWMVGPVRDAIKSQAVSGMSFRFQVRAEQWHFANGDKVPLDKLDDLLWSSNDANPSSILKRTITDVDLYEVGPVVFPAYADTSVGVRSQELIKLLSDPQVRAEAARILVGTPTESSDPKGGSGGEGREADNPDEPQVRRVPSPQARDRGLRLQKEASRHG